MADRWSNPSGSKGNQRFRVWPSGSDTYDHIELTDNWDKLDAIIGIPATGTWPATLGTGGGIYYEIQKAKEAAMPLGVALPWFRPTIDLEIPDGYVVADGSIIAAADHQIPNISGTYTVPDLRNKFVVGASATGTLGAAGVTIEEATINAGAGAPGPLGEGSANTINLSMANMAAHRHTGSMTGWGPLNWTWYDDNGGRYPKAGNWEVWRNGEPGCATSVGAGGAVSGQHRHKLSLAEQGEGKHHENRPLYVGLIWLVKVRNIA